MPKVKVKKETSPKLLGIIIIVVVASLCAVIVWNRWVQYESSEASSSIDNQEEDQALSHIKRLGVLQPTAARNKLLYAKAIQATDPEEAMQALETLLQNPNSDVYRESAIAYINLCIVTQELEKAANTLSAMKESYNGDSEIMMLKVRLLAQQGKLEEAMEELTYLINIQPNSAEAQLARAELLLSQPRITNWIEAKSALKEASNAKDGFGLEALLTMGRRPEIQLFPDERTWLAAQLTAHPMATTEAHMMAATQRIIADEGAKQTIISETTTQFGQEQPLAVAEWLISIGAAKDAMELLNRADLPKSRERWVLQYQAALQDQNLAELKRLIALDYSAANEIQKQTLELIFNLEDSEQLSPAVWKETFQTAEKEEEIDSLTALARLAGINKWWDDADQAYQAAIRFAPSQYAEANLKREYLTVILSQNRTEEALQVSTELRQVFPANPVYQNNFFYFRALLGKNEEEDLKQLTHIQQILGSTELNATVAYLLYLDGNPTKALQKLDTIPQWLKNQADVNLLKGLILINLGDIESGKLLLSAIDPGHLLPEENQLRTKALAK
ncbi:tetratricopeptide repeat protein [Cerasicoccus fimbriatus]|uniref:tetratricopeptide repeat protein n=1 Tax=Cerasicoccus fimbriatus TaxID=3014554 RepID=UPI0022B4FB00|nr:hypothetical protein [Cerasicoccus sp. TK19100]